jgi:hypothetical protein
LLGGGRGHVHLGEEGGGQPLGRTLTLPSGYERSISASRGAALACELVENLPTQSSSI